MIFLGDDQILNQINEAQEWSHLWCLSTSSWGSSHFPWMSLKILTWDLSNRPPFSGLVSILLSWGQLLISFWSPILVFQAITKKRHFGQVSHQKKISCHSWYMVPWHVSVSFHLWHMITLYWNCECLALQPQCAFPEEHMLLYLATCVSRNNTRMQWKWFKEIQDGYEHW